MTYYDEPQGGPNGPSFFAKIARYLGIAVSLLVVAMLVMFAYSTGTRDAAQVPVIQALGGDVRTAPEDSGGQEFPHQGLEVNDVLASDEPSQVETDVALAPAPETLDDIDPIDLEGEFPDALTNENFAETDSEGFESTQSGEASGITEEEAIAAALAQVEESEPTIAVALPASRPSSLPVPSSPAPAPIATTTVDQPEEAVVASEPETVASVAPGTAMIQLGAFDSEAVVRDQWAERSRSNSDILGGKQLFIQKADVNGRTYYRLRVTGFDGGAGAQSACQALISRGVDCLAVSAN